MTEELKRGYREGEVWEDLSGSVQVNFTVSIVGWGETGEGTKFW
jgi:hypothetical protein